MPKFNFSLTIEQATGTTTPIVVTWPMMWSGPTARTASVTPALASAPGTPFSCFKASAPHWWSGPRRPPRRSARRTWRRLVSQASSSGCDSRTLPLPRIKAVTVWVLAAPPISVLPCLLSPAIRRVSNHHPAKATAPAPPSGGRCQKTTKRSISL